MADSREPIRTFRIAPVSRERLELQEEKLRAVRLQNELALEKPLNSLRKWYERREKGSE